MTSNSIGKGTKNITANVPDDVAEQITALAKRCGMSRSKYIRSLFEHASMFDWKFTETRQIQGKEPGTTYGRKRK